MQVAYVTFNIDVELSTVSIARVFPSVTSEITQQRESVDSQEKWRKD